MANNGNSRSLVPVLVIAACLLVLGYWTFQSCSSDDEGSDETTSQQSPRDDNGENSREPVPVPIDTDATPPPTPSADNVPKEVLSLAREYVTAKENKEAFNQTDQKSWTNEVTAITGPLVHDQWKSIDTGDRPGYAWMWAHQKRVKTAIKGFECRDNPEVPSPDPKKMLSIRCGWIAVPVYANGEQVPPNNIDFTWEYNGPRGPAVLSVVNNGGWKITMDATGIAQ